jgi:putative endonuclease
MIYCCYIIYSSSIDRYYIGYSSDIDERLKLHNEGKFGGKSFTHRADDWKIYLLINCDSIEQAVFVESRIKNMKSRTYIENLKRNPEMAEKILREYCEKEKRSR